MLAEIEREFPEGDGAAGAGSKDGGVGDAVGEGPNGEPYRSEWQRLQRHLPADVRAILRTIFVIAYRVDATHEVERRVHGWQQRRCRDPRRSNAWVRLDAAGVRRAWQAALGDPREKALQKVRWVVDLYKKKAQVAVLQDHEVAEDVAEWQRAPTFSGGTITIRDVERGTKTFGVRSYPEVTPIEVVKYVMGFLVTFYPERVPAWRAWDLTAGSGTVPDLLATLFKAEVTAIDLTIENATVKFGDLLRIDSASSPIPGTRPHVVFIHPPSRGKPSVSSFYDLRDHAADLSTFSREDWIRAVVFATGFSLKQMDEGGVVSLLIPEGTRDHQAIVPDPSLTDDVLAAFEGHVLVVERLQVLFPAPWNQATFGKSRVPTTHLLLARGESW